MKLIDTHSHLYLDAFDADRPEVMQRAKAVGIGCILLPNIDSQSIVPLKKMLSEYPGFCFPMMGLHPSSVDSGYREQLAQIREELIAGSFVAVGEIGIDLYWDKTFREEQKNAFDLQLDWAIEFDLPVAIHMRESYEVIMEVIDRKPRPGLKGVFHCFTGTSEQANEIISRGFYLGIGGVLTYKNSSLPEVLSKVDPHRIVLETDSPYLPPIPHRGKRNESSYVTLLLPYLARIWSMSEAEVAGIVTANAIKLFNL